MPEKGIKKNTWQIGLACEVFAAQALLDQNPEWILWAKNFRIRKHEIDLIFEKRDQKQNSIGWIFVEVRSRSRDTSLSYWCSPQKTKRFRKAVRLFLAYLNRFPTTRNSMTLRMDLVLIEGQSVRHYPGFFSAHP